MRLSIIIVSYNTKKLVKDCLDSFLKDLPSDYEVILVDNASNDGTLELVETKFPQVKLIKNKTNTGFAQANNQGIAQAKGSYVLFLNSDTFANVDSFKTLAEFFDHHPKAGILSPKLLNPDQSIQQNGGALPTLWNVFAWQFFLDEIPLLTHLFNPYQQDDPEYYLKTRQTGWVSGAAMALRRTMLDDIGLLDKDIFMYAEDTELCLRAHLRQWQVWTVAEGEIIHIGQGSGNKAKAILGEYKGMLYLFAKHYPKQLPVIRTILYYGALVRAQVYRLLGNQEKYAYYQEATSLVRQAFA